MDDAAGFDKKQAVSLYQVLRERLRQSSKGKQLITAFEKDPEQGSEPLANYLREHLPEDTAFAEQIAQALGGDQANQFTTLVTGGQVDQIVNIARLGVLNLTLKRQFFIFRNVRQVVVFLLIVLLVGATVAYGVWLASQPRHMKSALNVAVAEFQEISNMPGSPVARTLSQNLFNYLDEELKKSGIDAETTHDKIDVITEAAEAKDLARSVNAHIVICGTVSVIGDKALLSPRFFVAESFADASELTGQHELGVPIEFSVTEVISPDGGVHSSLRIRTGILVELVKGLAYYHDRKLGPALEAIEDSIELSKKYGDFPGKETLYLVAANIASSKGDLESAQGFVDEALRLNPSYGRAYIAQANIYYTESDFEEAIHFYDLARDARDRSNIAYVDQKADYGVGSVYVYLYQTADEQDQESLGQLALSYLGKVIASYEDSKDENLKELAALSIYGAGIVYQREGRLSEARANYKRVRCLTENANLKQRAKGRLSTLD